MSFSSIFSRASLLYLTFKPNVVNAATKLTKVVCSPKKRNLVLLQHVAKSSCKKRLLSVSSAINPNLGVGLDPRQTPLSPTSLQSHISQLCCRPYSSDGYDDERDGEVSRPLKLMRFPKIWWPSPIKWFKNKLFTALIIGYFDQTFNMETFLNASLGAVEHVSRCISNGEFSALKGLVTSPAIEEIQSNYEQLDIRQRRFLAVNAEDIFYMFIYEIGMILDSNTNQRFVEITVGMQGFHDYHEVRQKTPAEYMEVFRENVEQMYICNYRFIREYTKGVDGDWTINKLNHFTPWTERG